MEPDRGGQSGKRLPPGVAHPEALLRLNFLHQAATLQSLCDVTRGTGGKLSRAYGKTFREVAQKLVIRLYVVASHHQLIIIVEELVQGE